MNNKITMQLTRCYSNVTSIAGISYEEYIPLASATDYLPAGNLYEGIIGLVVRLDMSFKKTIKREIEVATAKHAQPIWVRILKYVLLGLVIYFLWGTKWLWITLAALFVVAMTIHFFVRYKTHGWTKSYGLWKYEKNKPRDP